MIKVVHCKKEKGEYIGRPSALGNRFTHKNGTRADTIVESREVAVAMYRDWLITRIKEKDKAIIIELKRLKQLALKGDLNLACWCAPQACHGDVVKEMLDRSIRKTLAKKK